LRRETTSARKRSRRRGSPAWPLLSVVALACGPTNLPNDQLLSSPHFRYHARADTVLDPTILDRLEAHRSELDRTLGFDNGVIDYYRFRDGADRDASTGCNAECTVGRSVFAVTPFQEHELVHATLADVNEPALVLQEGTAQYFACLFPGMAPPTPPGDWPEIGSASIFNPLGRPQVVYHFGQRLVSWMSQTGGTPKLLDFYRGALLTSDPAVFALQFKRFWNRRLGDVAGELLDERFAGSFCSCSAPALPPEGSSTSFVAGQDYRTLDVAQESRLELSSDQPRLVAFPFACANALIDWSDGDPLQGGVGTALTVARVGPGRYGITAPSVLGETITVNQTQRAMTDWSCEAAVAHPIALGNREVTAWVTSDRATETTWFAFELDRLTALRILSPETDFTICRSCSDCSVGLGGGAQFPGDDLPVTPPPSGPLLIRLLKTAGRPPTNLTVRLGPWQ
jgi:hypothetical protein